MLQALVQLLAAITLGEGIAIALLIAVLIRQGRSAGRQAGRGR